MPVKITTQHDPLKVETICMTVYSNPGLGKTSLAFTASNPLLLDFDKGAYRAENRGDTVQVSDWRDIAEITKADVEAYDTIVIDTVGKALDSLTQEILRTQSRLGYGGALNQQGWGQLGVKFRGFLSRIQGFGKDVVLIAHMDEQKDGDAVRERLKIPGGSKDLVLTDSDTIARISIQDGSRYLIFNPTEASFGKDPGKIGASPIPPSDHEKFEGYLGRCIQHIKEKLNPQPDKGEMEWFTDALPQAMDADAINAITGRAHKAGREVEAMVAKRAREIGLEYDPDSKSWVYLEEFEPGLTDEIEAGEPGPAELLATG